MTARIRRNLARRGVFDPDRLPPRLEMIQKYTRLNQRKAAAAKRLAAKETV